MNLQQTMSMGEAITDRELEALDEAILAQDDAESQAREELRFVDVLDELSIIDEAMILNRLLAGPKNAAVDIHEVWKAALERAVKLRAAEILKEQS